MCVSNDEIESAACILGGQPAQSPDVAPTSAHSAARRVHGLPSVLVVLAVVLVAIVAK